MEAVGLEIVEYMKGAYGALVSDIHNSEPRMVRGRETPSGGRSFVDVSSQLQKEDRIRMDIGQVEHCE